MNKKDERANPPPGAGNKSQPAKFQAEKLLESVSDSIVALDNEWRYTYVNEKAAQTLGRTREQLIGKHIWTEFPEGVEQPFYKAYHKAVETQQPIFLEEYYPPYDRWFENRIYPSKDGLSIFFHDITERKQAEDEMRRNEQIFRLFVEHSPAAIAMFDRDMKYIVASRRYQIDYDLGDQDVVGRSHYEIFPEMPERWKEIHRRCLAGATEKNEEDPFPRLSGKTDWVRWEIRPWYERTGEIGGIILFSEVITERKRAEEELRLHRDRLADLSRRLVEVHEAESRAIGRELHDQIGQMLTALKLTLEIASQQPPELREKKNKQTQELVNDLLKRVSALSLELRPPMLDDLGLIPALLWHISRFEEQTGIAVGFKHSGAEGRRFSAEVETTAYRVIQEAFTNIARHARAGRTRLEVHAGSGQMKIQIEDDGAGFDPQAAFKKHRGLSGMRERINLLGGSFRIESQPGKGTKKFIQLPLKEDA
ncbi:MAG: PAS domain-containing protein [Chloroflexi bacterium]|nr:PAS domain-containing protein [Chloroflexota bacterium]